MPPRNKGSNAMQTATYVALAQQSALENSIDVASNNIANISTPAFKGQTVLFQEFLQPGPDGKQISYVRNVGVVRDTKPGNLSQTGNTLDNGIEGDGYFTVGTQDGNRYTRNGRFQLDNGGRLVTSQGYTVLSDQGTPIAIPANSHNITVTPDGGVSTENGPVGKLGLAHFDNQQDLVAAADGLYVTADQPIPDTISKVHQGTVEDSNVQPITALTRLLGMQKAYTGAEQMIDDEDTRLKNAIDKISKVA
ncbi:MAG TPA: flagellar basal-body rod protein FlgF [Aliidongia sp.]|nr:flagellar basal-body rod protein FlgF [Aliidongia sp.]